MSAVEICVTSADSVTMEVGSPEVSVVVLEGISKLIMP
jgi:hypothetical protein